MASVTSSSTSSGGSTALARSSRAAPFEVFGDGFSFAPFFYPRRVVVGKEHNLKREDNICGNEDVSSTGSKNREIHIVGILRQHERYSFETLMDQSDPVNLISLSWSGEVYVENADYEGPIGFDPHTNEYHWQYTLDLVSSGVHEDGFRNAQNGIISRGYRYRR